uniref:Uncharacterized protein n=1 Tax=Anguilla anguilla TaxID=7936 RepID=A0A0E9UF82_ANGAN
MDKGKSSSFRAARGRLGPGSQFSRY